MKMKEDQSGFTLVETVVVLFITGALILLPVLSINKIVETIQIDLFFRELASDITMMQNYTILTGKQTRISFFSSDKDTISFRIASDPKSPLNRDVELDSPYYSLSLPEGNYVFSFTWNAGNIDSSKKIGFNTTKGKYELTYLLGSGRFDIKKAGK